MWVAAIVCAALLLGALGNAGAALAASLSVDMALAGGVVDTQPGFEAFAVANNVQSASKAFGGGFTVTLTNHKADYIGARHWLTPTDSGLLTTSALYRDFVFAHDKSGQAGEPPLGTERGFDLLIEGLLPNTTYDARFWSYAPGNTGNRVSAWSVAGEALPFIEYAFDGGVLGEPDSNDDYQFSTTFTATAAGSVTFQPRRLDTSLNSSGEHDHGVFLNAFEITPTAVPIPLPAAAWMGLALFGCMAASTARRKLRKA